MAKSAPSQHWWRSSSPSLFQHFHQRRKWKRRSGDAGGGGRPSGGCRDSMWERTAENENERTTEKRGREDWSFWSWSMALPLGFSYIHTVKRFMGKKRGSVRQWRMVRRITWVVGESLPTKACGKTRHCEVRLHRLKWLLYLIHHKVMRPPKLLNKWWSPTTALKKNTELWNLFYWSSCEWINFIWHSNVCAVCIKIWTNHNKDIWLIHSGAKNVHVQWPQYNNILLNIGAIVQ